MKSVWRIFVLFLVVVITTFLASCTGSKVTRSDNGNISKSEVKNNTLESISKEKILVAYFSHTGNTKAVAEEIHKNIGGDIFEISTVKSYPKDHGECSAIAQQELRNNDRPKLSTHVKNINSYDVIFLGYPIWWHTAPMAIRTFLEEYNFSGKTIVPFCTSLGDGIDESVKDISQICPNSNILDGLALRNVRADSISNDLLPWLKKIKIIK